MEWQQILAIIQDIKTKFDKSYKCPAQNRNILIDTISKHAKILVEYFNEARTLIHNNRKKLNQSHWSLVFKLLVRPGSNLVSVQRRYNLDISIPTILNTPLTLRISEELDSIDQVDTDLPEEDESESNTNQVVKQKDLHDLRNTRGNKRTRII